MAGPLAGSAGPRARRRKRRGRLDGPGAAMTRRRNPHREWSRGWRKSASGQDKDQPEPT
jgi:hypothetical protein